MRLLRSRDATEQEAARGVALALIPWKLQRWLSSDPGVLCSLYEALGWSWPWGLTRLQRTEHEQLMVNRLADAFEQGLLIAVMEEPARLVDQMIEHPAPAQHEPLDWTPPSRQKPAAPEPSIDVAAQAQTLRQAAREGVPFCEECEKRPRQRAAA